MEQPPTFSQRHWGKILVFALFLILAGWLMYENNGRAEAQQSLAAANEEIMRVGRQNDTLRAENRALQQSLTDCQKRLEPNAVTLPLLPGRPGI